MRETFEEVRELNALGFSIVAGKRNGCWQGITLTILYMVAIPRDDVKPCIAVEKTGLARTCPMSDARLRRPRGGREDRSSLGFSVPGAGTVCPSRTGSIALFGPLRGGAFPVDRPRREIGAVGSAEDHDFGWVAV